MSDLAEFQPSPDDRGLATADPQELAIETMTAWDDFLQLAGSVDLEAKTRSRNLHARQVIARVGDWPEGRQLPQILADAAAGKVGDINQDEVDDRVVAAHGNDPAPQLLAAIARARDTLGLWMTGQLPQYPPFEQISLREVASPLGTLPVITYLHAAAFQLAISARDMHKAGAQVPESLELAGLRALLDTTGALAARMRIDASVAVVTPAGAVFTGAADGGWLTGGVDPALARDRFPGIEGDIGVVLDIAAGRRNPVRRLHRREIAIRDLPGLLALAPIAQDVPGLPGGAVLRRAAGFLSTFGKSPRKER